MLWSEHCPLMTDTNCLWMFSKRAALKLRNDKLLIQLCIFLIFLILFPNVLIFAWCIKCNDDASAVKILAIFVLTSVHWTNPLQS